MAISRKGVCLRFFLCGDMPVKKCFEALLEEWKDSCSRSVPRRNEMTHVGFEIVDDPQKATVAIGFPGELLACLKGERGTLLSVILVLKDSSWDDSVKKLHGDKYLSVIGIFRQSHLIPADSRDRDLDELARLQSILTSLFRLEFRKKFREEDLYKNIDWKAKISGETGSSFFSLCADPSTRGLMDDIKAGFRSMADEASLAALRRFKDQLGNIVGVGKLKSVAEVFEKEKPVFRRIPSILLLGETGTGKSLLARWIAESLSLVFAPMNISAVPSDLVDSTLFGAKEGAYTGMEKGKDVLGFFLANIGKVVFLDEIGDMRADHQTRLLTYMDSGTVRPVGYDDEPISAPAILVAATNRPLREWVASGKDGFRGDLLHRFDHVVEVPPIRERQADRKLLISLILQDEEINPLGAVDRISLDAIRFLAEKDYPGNFRELRFAVRRAVQKAAREGIDILCLRHCL